RQHERPIGVFRHADDPADVHAALPEGGRHARERARSIVQLDREPDRHRAPPVLAMVPRAIGRRGGRYAHRMPPTGPTVQVFGLENDQSTRAALRFFKERRVAISFIDLRKRAIAQAELRRFVDRLGARSVLDETSRAYRDAGLGYLRMTDAEIADRLLADARL